MVKQLLFIALLACTALTSSAQNQILGYWIDENRETIIEIYERNNTYNGRIVWIANEVDGLGNERRDVYNPNPELRSRKVLGIDMLTGFAWDGTDTWRKGDIYYYRTGNDYNGKITLEDGQLHLKGYYSILFFLGRTKVWSRPQQPELYGLK
jgi:uncharacterized protein (DUF2147 family)